MNLIPSLYACPGVDKKVIALAWVKQFFQNLVRLLDKVLLTKMIQILMEKVKQKINQNVVKIVQIVVVVGLEKMAGNENDINIYIYIYYIYIIINVLKFLYRVI